MCVCVCVYVCDHVGVGRCECVHIYLSLCVCDHVGVEWCECVCVCICLHPDSSSPVLPAQGWIDCLQGPTGLMNAVSRTLLVPLRALLDRSKQKFRSFGNLRLPSFIVGGSRRLMKGLNFCLSVLASATDQLR